MWRAGRADEPVWRIRVGGVGARCAAEAAQALLHDGARALLCWGVAGGLQSHLAPGAIFVADRVADPGGVEPVDADACSRLLDVLREAGLPIVSGGLWSSPHAVTEVSAKRELALAGWAAVDMESAAVARVARMAGVPFAAIRAISDPAERALPSAATHLLRPDGRVRVMALLALLLRGPEAWRALGGMRRDFAAACAGLRQVSGVVPLSWTA